MAASCCLWTPTTSCLWFFLLVLVLGTASAQLSSDFYASSCPNVLPMIRSAIDYAVTFDRRLGASVLRLHFHDCFVNGCDASVLLDDTENFLGEKRARANLNSIRGFSIIDTVKSQVETLCPGVVSCADILAVAARDAVVTLGGPSWTVLLGRRDSTTASLSAANSDIPSPNMNLSALISLFSYKGFTAKEMVALTGAHTIGKARCSSFRERVYNETNIDSQFAELARANCSITGSDNNLFPLDITSPTDIDIFFDNEYFKNLRSQKGLLHSDQQLYSGGSTDSYVNNYSSKSTNFFADFAAAMMKMGNLSTLTGSNGQVRTDCRKVNPRYVYELYCDI